jgi:nitroimidazol reductase NimA-like FMN-containing flavoprotein (pyridoxamine 5'-phosphate oxidase superfamily)
MAQPEGAMDELGIEECWELLGSAEVGRLAVSIAEWPDIFPVNYVVDDRSIVFRTAGGTKLAGAVLGRSVAFEIDGYDADAGEAWSVVAKGPATELDSMAEMFAAEELPLFPWHTSPKPHYVRVRPDEVTGRRFHVAGR